MRNFAVGLLLLQAIAAGVSKPAGAQDKPEIFVQLGHVGGSTAAAFSADGALLVTGGSDDTVKLWDAASALEIVTFKGHAEDVIAVAVSSDLRHVASGDAKGNIKLWEVGTGRELKSFPGRGDGISHLAFSPDGQLFTSLSMGKLTRWRVSGGPAVEILDRIKGSLFVPANSPFAARSSATELDQSSLIEIATGREARQFKDTAGFASSAAFTRAGDRALFLGNDYAVKRNTCEYVDTTTGRKIASWTTDESVSKVGLSPDGRIAFTAGGSGLRLWDAATGKELKTLTTSLVLGADFSPDGRTIVAVGTFAPTLWDVSTAQVVRSFAGRPLAIPQRSMFGSDGKQAMLSFHNAPPVLWDLTAARVVRRFVGYSTAHGFNSRYVLLRGAGNAVSVWDVSADKAIASYQGNAVAASPDYRYVAVKTTDHDVTVSEIATGKAIVSVSEPAGAISFPDFSRDGRFLLLVLKHGAKLIALPSGAVIRTFAGPADQSVWGAIVSADGKHVAAMTDGRIILWETSTGREIKTFEQVVPAAYMHFSPDGSQLLFATKKELALCDVATGASCRAFRGHREVIWALGFSNDGKTLLSGSMDKEIKLWNAATGAELATLSGHRYAIGSARFSADDRFVLSTSNDGTTRSWDAATGREVAQLIGFADGEWIAITPQGQFNASANAGRYLSVKAGGSILGIDQFWERFYDPVFVASALQGRPAEAREDLRKGVALPPEVRIVSPVPGAAFSSEAITITVSAKDKGGGNDEIRLFHNGKAIGGDQRALKARGDSATRTYAVLLSEGTNTFRAVGFSRDRTESSPHEIAVTLKAPAKDAALHVIAVGINKYRNPALNLNYAEPDARGILEFFRLKGKGLFKTVTLDALYDEQATKSNIVSRLERLKDTRPEDVVLIYLASHGESVDEKWYLIPHELTYPEREEDVKTKGLSSAELAALMKQARAQKVLLLIDACKSGAVLVAFRGFEDRRALSQLSRSAGVHVIAASTKDQLAAEVKTLGHGVFTHTLLEGLSGAASGGGPSVTVRKLMGFVEERLPDITLKYKQEAQYPVVDSRGMDFPLVLVGAAP